MFLSVIIPAYNEEERLPGTLAATAAYFDRLFPEDYEILVVDDGSTDATARAAREFAAKHPSASVKVLDYGGNRGKGFAVRYGMVRGAGQWRLFCDADLATPVEEYSVVAAAMEAAGAEIGIGSRPLRQSRLLVRQPRYREFLGRSFNKVVQMLGVPGIQDTQCGFKIFSARSADDIFARCRLDGFAFDVEALFLALKLGYKIVEVPIRWSHMDGSKVSMVRDGVRMVRDLLRIRAIHRAFAPKLDAARPSDPVLAGSSKPTGSRRVK